MNNNKSMEQCRALERALRSAGWEFRDFMQQYTYWKNYCMRDWDCVRPPMMDRAKEWQAVCDALDQIPPRGNIAGQKLCFQYAMDRDTMEVLTDEGSRR